MPPAKSPAALLRSLALRHPNVEEGVACQGTAVESNAFKIKKKTFLFARDVDLMLKLQASIPEANACATGDPLRYRPGKGGWVSVKFDGGVLPPKDLLTRWIAESYQLMAAPPAKKSRPKSK